MTVRPTHQIRGCERITGSRRLCVDVMRAHFMRLTVGNEQRTVGTERDDDFRGSERRKVARLEPSEHAPEPARKRMR